MCDGTKGSDPAHPQFWHNYLPNEEQIENPKIIFWESQKSPSNFKKLCMNDTIASVE